jgi:TolB-like protein
VRDPTDAAARWDRVTALYGEAESLAPPERRRFLDQACADDPTLRAELDALLGVSGEASGFFGALATEAIPTVLSALEDGASAGHIGRTYGAYHVVAEIGRGGMGVVYRAEDTRLGRSAALKFLPHFLVTDARARERLVREARAASRLDDANICTIFGVEDTPDGEMFIAMAYYAGETLAQRLARGPVLLPEALDIALRIARGLAAAHRAGITHRDLTPRNVMLTARHEVKILDFGLAEAAGHDTDVGAGTPAYMSPEQARGEPVGAASDVWSLGVTMYELFTGKKPFDLPDVHATIDAVVHAEPQPLTALAPNIPDAVERLVFRMLRKHPAERPADAAEVVAELEPIIERRRLRKLRLAVAGAALFALAVLAFAVFRPAVTPPRTVPAVRVVFLPLSTDTTGPNSHYLALGLHEVISAQLGRLPGVALISWTSAIPGENTPAMRRRLARALSAVAVLEGDVPKNEIVTLRLHDADDDRLLWSKAFNLSKGLFPEIGRIIALEAAAPLGIRPPPRAPEVLQPGVFATDRRTGHVYEAVSATLNWYDAEEAAAAREHQGVRGHLATITSEAENDFLRHSLPLATSGRYWLGGYRAVRGGTSIDGWAWVTEEPFTYHNWAGAGPNDYFGEDGIQFWGDSAKWNDIDRVAGYEAFVGGFVVEYDGAVGGRR